MSAAHRRAGSSLATAILDRFTTGLARPTVVEDPDGLLREAGIIARLEEQGFDVLFLKDPIEFRFTYESRFRVPRDRGRDDWPELVVVVENEGAEPPFDLTDGAERVSLRLPEFFPNLSSTVVGELEPLDRATLFLTQDEAGRKRLGDDETRDFVRRSVVRRDPEVATSGLDGPRQHVGHLLDVTGERLPREDGDHRAWRSFARMWADARAAFVGMVDPPSEAREAFRRLEGAVDERFAEWLPKQYGPLASLPSHQPVMLHHVPQQLAQELEERNGRVALLVLDGLALWQWVILRQELRRSLPGLRLDEDAVFAWIPTLTVVSRQALFAGRPPLFFPNSIQSTSREPGHWQRFWQEQGLGQHQIAYRKGVEAPALPETEVLVANPKIRALGLIVNTVDDIVHGMKLGERGMANQVRQWAAGRFLAGLLDKLLAADFDVWLTSDHGNIEARGTGNPREGVVANLRGERVRIFPDESLRTRVADGCDDAVRWPSLGLPEDFVPLLAPGRDAFVAKGKSMVCHGGAALEEVIVPLVRITRPTS